MKRLLTILSLLALVAYSPAVALADGPGDPGPLTVKEQRPDQTQGKILVVGDPGDPSPLIEDQVQKVLDGLQTPLSMPAIQKKLVEQAAKPFKGGPNNAEDTSADSTVWQVTMTPGSSAGDHGSLYDTWMNGEVDAIVLVLVGTGTLTMDIVDGYIQGDTMLGLLYVLRASGWTGDYAWATSPDFLRLTMSVNGWAIVIMYNGYLAAPGGFPAGYDWTAEFQ